MKHEQSSVYDTSELDDIRSEYKTAKRKLEKYDTFTDNNQTAITSLLIVLAIVGIIAAVFIDYGKLAKSGIFYASLALFPVGIIFAIISGARQSSRKRLEQKIERLRREAALFQKQSNETRSNTHVTRDELGLWRDIEQDTSGSHSNKGGWVMGIIVIVVVAAVISINQANQRNQEAAERARQTQIIEQQRAKQEQDAIEQRKLDQQDEANRLQQQKNAIDLYNSTKPDSSDYRSSTNCSTSYYGGYTAYTTCD